MQQSLQCQSYIDMQLQQQNNKRIILVFVTKQQQCNNNTRSVVASGQLKYKQTANRNNCVINVSAASIALKTLWAKIIVDAFKSDEKSPILYSEISNKPTMWLELSSLLPPAKWIKFLFAGSLAYVRIFILTVQL